MVSLAWVVPKRDIEIIYPVTCLSLSRKEKFYKPQLSTYFYLYGVLNVIFQCKTFLKQLWFKFLGTSFSHLMNQIEVWWWRLWRWRWTTQGHMAATKESVTIKVPRVPDFIRKEKKEVGWWWFIDIIREQFHKNHLFLKVKTHIEEAKRLLSTNFRKPRGEHLVRYLGASYDDFRKEIWVVSALFVILLFWEE